MKILLYLFRNCFIFGSFRRPIIPFKINLLYYKRSKGLQNVGDLLSVVLFDFLLSEKNISKWSFHTKRLSLIGSIIQFISAKTIVFGSGFLDSKSIDVFKAKKPSLDIKAVRGPLTAEALRCLGYAVPYIYGDPAILMPYFYKPAKKIHMDYLVIPHYSKLDKYKGYNTLSTLTNDWRDFIDSIYSVDIVISSSLHGIILAEAYGILAVFLNDTESEDIFKYKDYYYSTGRKNFVICNTVEEGLLLATQVYLPDLKEMQERLLNNFSL